MRVWLEQQEITGLCLQVVIAKEADSAGAEAEITLVCAPMDSRLPRLDPACGQQVRVMQEGEILFFGRVERVSYDAAALRLTLLCYDPAALLAKYQGRGPYEGTPDAIVRALCRECGLESGEIWAGDGQPVKLTAACGRSAFRAIRNLYDDRCVVAFREGKVCVSPKGAVQTVLESGQLISLTARFTAEEAVTRVVVYSGGKPVAQAEDKDGLAQLGLRQRTEHLSPLFPKAKAQAAAGLKALARQARLTLTGRCSVQCGQIVRLDKPLMGVYGDYLVTEVIWRCQQGLTTTELGVSSL